MTRIHWIWLSTGLVYAAFFSWYTSFSGPLTEREIDRYLQHFEQRGVAAHDPSNTYCKLRLTLFASKTRAC